MGLLVRYGALAFAIGLPAVVATTARAQAPIPPKPDPRLARGDLARLTGQMAEQVRRVGEAVASDQGDNPRSRGLQQESAELAQALDEYRMSLAGRPEGFGLRRAYAGIDDSWHHLAARLTQPGASGAGVGRALGRAVEIDGRLHQVLGLNAVSAGFYSGTAPGPAGDVQRLAHALVDRADEFAAVARTELRGPGSNMVVQDAVNLAQLADTYHDAVDLNGRVDAALRNGYSGVAGIADRLAAAFAAAPPPPRVQASWQAVRSADLLLRQALGLAIRPEDRPGTVLVQTGPSPVVALADQLVQQVGAFVQVFGPTAGRVPEGGLFLADAQALLAAASDFRQDVARGLNPAQLAAEFRDVDAVWQRLARRTNRIARGRTGPNIQQVGLMGQTVGEIHRLLGIPGYVVTFPPAS